MGCRTLLILLVLGALLVPLAQAEGTPGATTIWTEDHALTGVLQVANNSTLIVRGATLSLDNGLIVLPGSTLILESTDEAPARILANNRNVTVVGAMFLNGSAAHPVVVEGLGGRGNLSGNNALLQGGFTVGGHVEGHYVNFTDYKAGLSARPGGDLTLRNVTFDSPEGLGLVLLTGKADIRGAQFRGPGGLVFLAAESQLNLEDASFQDSPLPMNIGPSSVTMRNVSVSNATTCAYVFGGKTRIVGFACSQYHDTGVLVARGDARQSPELVIEHGLIATTVFSATEAVGALRSGHVTLVDTGIGPTPGNGVNADSTPITLDNVTFHGIGKANVYLVDPDNVPERAQVMRGAPGQDGWLSVWRRTNFTIVDHAGGPPQNVTLSVLRQDGTPLTRRGVNASTGPFRLALETEHVGSDGRDTNPLYILRASDSTTGEVWENRTFEPGIESYVIQMVPGRASTPGLAPLLLVAAIGGVAVLSRRR